MTKYGRPQLIGLAALLLSFSLMGQEEEEDAPTMLNITKGFVESVLNDYQYYYSAKRLWELSLLVAGTGVLANTELDKEIYDLWEDNIRHSSTNEVADVINFFGCRDNFLYLIPGYIGLTLWGGYAPDNSRRATWGTWSERVLRGYVLAIPQQAILTNAIGASRPILGDSHWRPYSGKSRAVSGHVVALSMPFVTAAKMMDTWQSKAGFYFLSTLPMFARINTESHYPSQVILAWSLVYLAASSIDVLEREKEHTLKIVPFAVPDGIGLGIQRSF